MWVPECRALGSHILFIIGPEGVHFIKTIGTYLYLKIPSIEFCLYLKKGAAVFTVFTNLPKLLPG